MTFPNKEIVHWFGLNQKSRHLIWFADFYIKQQVLPKFLILASNFSAIKRRDFLLQELFYIYTIIYREDWLYSQINITAVIAGNQFFRHFFYIKKLYIKAKVI